jgi:hypothetical protein
VGVARPAARAGFRTPARRQIVLPALARYWRRASAWLRWLPAVLVLLPWLASTQPTVDGRIQQLAAPDSFRLLDWEAVHLAQRADRIWAGLVGGAQPRAGDGAAVAAYVAAQASPTAQPTGLTAASQGAERQHLRPAAEAAIERAVADVYRRQGAARADWPLLGQLFPPVLIAVTPPPNVLVVSPRTTMRVERSVMLRSDLDGPEQERLEAAADSNDVSSLVVPTGGIATYPSMVLEADTAESVLTSAAHEWAHQYLFFFPLGAGYWDSQETREINETTAELLGQEVGHQALADLGLDQPASQPGAAPAPRRRGFDFRRFMRETRQTAEAFLADGQVDAAEQYMAARRDELQTHGIVIRKLNQAYFAFYGSYTEGYAASPANPIPGLVRALRQQSPTAGAFLARIRGITTVDELRQAVASGA